MSAPTFCTGCGKEVTAAAKFCRYCGSAQPLDFFESLPEGALTGVVSGPATAEQSVSPAIPTEEVADAPTTAQVDDKPAAPRVPSPGAAEEPASSVSQATPPGLGKRPPDDDAKMDRLRRAAAEASKVTSLAPLPSGVVSHEVFTAASEAFAAGHGENATDAIYDEFAAATEAGRLLLTFAAFRENDEEFQGHTAEGLEVRRVDFEGPRVALDDLGLELVITPAGALIPTSTRRGETVLVNLAAEIQILGPNEDEARAELVHSRGFDERGLFGSVAMNYSFRVTRRLLWGAGLCLLTDCRAAGLVFDRDSGREDQATRERKAMPEMMAGANEADVPVGSIVVFSAERSAFTDKDVVVPVITRRVPEVNLIAETFDLSLSTFKVVDEHDLIVRPGKGQITAAVEAFRP